MIKIRYRGTKVTTFQCPKCGDVIYSRARHDYHPCTCKEISVDGGFDYLRVGFKDVFPKKSVKYIAATKQELFDDWNNETDKFGLIKPLTGSGNTDKVKA